MRILGIDPGSQRTGVGIIDVDSVGKVHHVYHAPLQLLGSDGFPGRLRRLLHQLTTVIETYRPDEVAIEQVFLSRNADSALKLGQARGAAMSAVVLHDLPIFEYAARQIKQAIVGRGGAEKKQVQHMVGLLLGVTTRLQSDAADALAIAITHAHIQTTLRRFTSQAHA